MESRKFVLINDGKTNKTPTGERGKRTAWGVYPGEDRLKYVAVSTSSGGMFRLSPVGGPVYYGPPGDGGSYARPKGYNSFPSFSLWTMPTVETKGGAFSFLILHDSDLIDSLR